MKADKGQEGGKVVEDFWKPAVKVICDSKFVDTLIAFDMDDVAVRTLRLLEERIFHHEEADAAKIRNYSAAAEGNNTAPPSTPFFYSYAYFRSVRKRKFKRMKKYE